MAEERVLKKEDKITQFNGFWHKAYKGTLVLTTNDLCFLSKKGNKEVLRMPLSSIVSVNTEKMDFADNLFVVYKDGNTERRTKFIHHDRRQLIFAAASPSHFLSWEQSINDARFHRSNDNSNTLSDLERLAVLKDKGALTADEFAAKKKELLGL
jgi:hypothetical protein